MNIQDQNKFEFLLTLDGNIICQRFFNVRDFNPDAKNSAELYDGVKNICNEITRDLEIKSSTYLVNNQNFFTSPEYVDDPKERNEQYFLLQLKQNEDVFMERIFPAHYFHPKVRYAVDIRPKLKYILGDLTEILSLTNPDTKYLQYDLK